MLKLSSYTVLRVFSDNYYMLPDIMYVDSAVQFFSHTFFYRATLRVRAVSGRQCPSVVYFVQKAKDIVKIPSWNGSDIILVS